MPPTASSDLHALALRLIPLLDLSLLDDEARPAEVEALCDAARTCWGEVAAVCVYPEHVTTARRRLGDSAVAVATVVNFPDGGEYIGRAVCETRRAVAAGADEIDLVLPYRALLRGELRLCADLVRAARRCCGPERPLKLIIECGELGDEATVRRACTVGLDEGVDFLKTSTGTVPVNATPAAARTMLTMIRDGGRRCGFKAAGGIRTLEEAAIYVDLAEALLGRDWLTPARFRIGASALLHRIRDVLEAPG